jgi:hypothetical protein
MHRKHTVNVFRDLPDLIYRMLSQVAAMRERSDGEIAAMKVRELSPAHAHHPMVEAMSCRKSRSPVVDRAAPEFQRSRSNSQPMGTVIAACAIVASSGKLWPGGREGGAGSMAGRERPARGNSTWSGAPGRGCS